MKIEDNTKTMTLNQRINQIWSTTQGKTYTTAIATIVVVVLMVVLAVVPAYMSITDQISLNELKTEYLTDLSIKQTNLNTLIQQQQDNTVAIRLLDIYMQDKVDSELLVAIFSQIGVQDNIKCRFDSVSFNEPEMSKKIIGLDSNVMSIGFNTSYLCKIGVVEDVYDAIINLPIPINIYGVSYTNKTTGGRSGDNSFLYDEFTVTYTGEYYYWAGPSLESIVDLTSTSE